MAGIPQNGLRYASIPSTLFDNDARIDRLLDAQGWRGVGVYIYLLLRAYGSYGYYVKWCYADCATTARKMGGGISARQVEEAIRCCTQVGLFDERLLGLWGVLTNIDIQQNYLEVIRKARRKVQIVSEYWLLEEKPPAGSLVSCGQNADECSINAHKCNNDEDKFSKDNSCMSMCMNGMNTTTTTPLDSSEEKHDSQLSLLSSPEKMAENKEKYGAALNQWERVTARPLPPHELDRICQLVEEYGSQWVQDAMGVAGDAGKPNLRYTQGILINWHRDGRDTKKPVGDSDEDLRATFM